MASNGPSNDPLSRAMQDALQHGNIPILGQQPKSTKRWQCQKCLTIVGPGQLVRLPDGPPFTPPESSILTILPGEAIPTYLCSACDVNVRRRLVPHLQEIDENGIIVRPGLNSPSLDDREGV